MKIKCACGNIIYDQTDMISYKASFVADQDFIDLSDALDQHIQSLAATLTGTPTDKASSVVEQTMHDVQETLRSFTSRKIYQCTTCGRLYVDDARFDSQVFVPNDSSVPRNLLRSIEGDNWKRPLRGRWSQWKTSPDQGELWWGFGDAEEGFEQFQDFDALQRRYFEVFARLRQRDIVRDALLRNGDDIIHEWP